MLYLQSSSNIYQYNFHFFIMFEVGGSGLWWCQDVANILKIGLFGSTFASKVENPIKFHPKKCYLSYLGQYSTRKKKDLWDQDFHLIQSGWGGDVLIPHIYGSWSIFYYIVFTKTLTLPMRNGNFLSLTNIRTMGLGFPSSSTWEKNPQNI